jgi:hypothetical protein
MAQVRRPRVWESLARFWQRDESLSVLLGLLVGFAFVLPPLAPQDGTSGTLTAALFSLVLVAGTATVIHQNRWLVGAVATLCLVALPLRWLAWHHGGGSFAVWSAAAETFALALLAAVVLAKVLLPGTVTRHRIVGAVAAYILLGLAWAGAFEWVALRDSTAFAGATAGSGKQWIYYSFVTLTTMGYGDILPVQPAARSLAAAEAITGQLFLAILISRLVALELAARRQP